MIPGNKKQITFLNLKPGKGKMTLSNHVNFFFPFEDQIFKELSVSTFWSLEVPKWQHRQEEMTRGKWQFSYLPRNAELGVINERLDHSWHFTKWLTIAPALARTHTHTRAERLPGDEKEGRGQNWVSSQGTQWVQNKKSTTWNRPPGIKSTNCEDGCAKLICIHM